MCYGGQNCNTRVATVASRTKGKTMVTKKTKGEVVKGKKAPHVVEIQVTQEQLLGGLQRFGTVCDYVESQMRKEREQNTTLERVVHDNVREVMGQAMQSAPKPSPSVEQMAHEMRELARDVAKQAEATRQRLTMGAEVPNGEGANGAVATQGPLKDYVENTTNLLFSIRRDLDTINQYAIG